MKSSKSSIKHLIIDGQEILVFAPEDWTELFLDPVIDSYGIGALSLIKYDIEIAAKHHEIILGLGFLSVLKKWMHYVFLRTEADLQRVLLEEILCNYCNWKGISANPMIIDLYLGDGIIEDHIALMRRAEKYPILKCPQCNSELPRHPIWIEKL